MAAVFALLAIANDSSLSAVLASIAVMFMLVAGWKRAMSQNPLPQASNLNTFRNRLAGRLANAVLRVADPHYRAFIRGSIEYGLRAAAKDVEEGREAP